MVTIYMLILAIIGGFFVYRSVGRPPQIANIQNGTDSTSSSAVLGTFTDGQEVSLAFPKGGRVSNVYVKAGDGVHKGQILANLASTDAQGAVNQASAQLQVAKANYNKILSGATGTDIDVFKAAVAKAQTNVDATKATQVTLVANAYRTVLNSSLQALYSGNNDTGSYILPTVSGTYTCDTEGTYTLKTYASSGGISINYSGVETGTLLLNTIPRPMGACGLFVSVDAGKDIQTNAEYSIRIPNKNAANYNSNYSAYQAAVSTQSQATVAAASDLNQAITMLTSKQATARPEDVAIAKAQVDSATGALEITEGQYSNNFISAPTEGIITVVNIHPGEIAAMNQKAVGMIIKTN
jgi:multidrug efflux pump subunit AcrA (membrane-fusion protein)